MIYGLVTDNEVDIDIALSPFVNANLEALVREELELDEDATLTLEVLLRLTDLQCLQ